MIWANPPSNQLSDEDKITRVNVSGNCFQNINFSTCRNSVKPTKVSELNWNALAKDAVWNLHRNRSIDLIFLVERLWQKMRYGTSIGIDQSISFFVVTTCICNSHSPCSWALVWELEKRTVRTCICRSKQLVRHMLVCIYCLETEGAYTAVRLSAKKHSFTSAPY